MSELNVLVVDDSKTARFAMRRYLERLQNLVQTAASAMEAYDYLKDHQPDVIFLDNVMPEISGLEALYTLKHDAKTAVIPVIFCTSIEKSEFVERARASGALQVLHKPPSLDQLSQVLDSIRNAPPAPVAPPAAADPVPPFERAVAAPETAEAGKRGLSGETTHPGNTTLDTSPNGNGPLGSLRHEIDLGMRKLTGEISVQLSELKTQLTQFDSAGLTSSELDAVRRIAHEEGESLHQSVHAELDKIRTRLDTIASMHEEEHKQLVRVVRDIASTETNSIAQRISERLSHSILRALGREV